MPSNKTAAAQAESYKEGGPGLKYRPTSSPANVSANMPKNTLGVSPNSEKRGKDGK